MKITKTLIGFSLIELLIVLTIMSILSALSFPLYTEHLAHARRLAAETTLTKLAAALEQYFIFNNTYQNASLETLGFPNTCADHHYRLAIETANNNFFAITATPLENQQDSCGTLRLNSLNEKTLTCS